MFSLNEDIEHRAVCWFTLETRGGYKEDRKEPLEPLGAAKLPNCCLKKSYWVAVAARSHAKNPLPAQACKGHWKVKGLGLAMGGDGKATVSLPRATIHTVPSCAGSGQTPCLTSLPAATAAKARNFPLLKLNWFSKNKLSSTFTQSEWPLLMEYFGGCKQGF